MYSPGEVGRDSQHLPLLTTSKYSLQRGKLLFSAVFRLPVTNALLLPWCVLSQPSQAKNRIFSQANRIRKRAEISETCLPSAGARGCPGTVGLCLPRITLPESVSASKCHTVP